MREEIVAALVARRLEMVQGSAKSQRKMRSLANREFTGTEPTEAEVREACQRVDTRITSGLAWAIEQGA